MARTGHGSRCRQHGGLSTGPKTPEGRDRIRFALLKHGQYTTEAKQERLEWRELVRISMELLHQLKGNNGRNELPGERRAEALPGSRFRDR
jgi:hypothetical protein